MAYRETKSSPLTLVARSVHHGGVWLPESALLLLGDDVIQRDWVDSMIANFRYALDSLEEYIGKGNAKYLFIGILLVLVLILIRRRR